MRRLLIFLAAVSIGAACSQPTPTQPAPPGEVDYTAVGASDAIGYGASVPCFPFTVCPNGTGYVQDLTRRLQNDKKTVNLLNLGVPGAVLSPDIQKIGNSLGLGIVANFLDGELPFVQTSATLVTIFAGANDVNTVGSALKAGLAGSDPNGYVATQTQTFARDVTSLVTGIQSRAPGARIVILNLPNMAAMPYVSGNSIDEKKQLQTIAVSFSAQINTLTRTGASVIDLMCDGTLYQPGFFSGDGFHPNDTGYAYLAGLIYTAANAATAPAPKASCAQMSIY